MTQEPRRNRRYTGYEEGEEFAVILSLAISLLTILLAVLYGRLFLS